MRRRSFAGASAGIARRSSRSLCAGIAVVLALLAADVSAWRSTVARDDLRFRALPAHRHLWRPSTTLPGDPASLLLGTGSTISYRHALQYFWFSRIGSNPEVRQDTPTLRATAQNKLLERHRVGAERASSARLPRTCSASSS